MAGLGPGHRVRRDRDGPFRRSLVDRVARSAAVGGGACILHPGGGPGWKAAAALHHAGRALAVARRPRTGRSAVSATAARLRGQALWRASRRRPARARPRLHAIARSRTHHLRRLDHHDAGRTPARTAHRAQPNRETAPNGACARARGHALQGRNPGAVLKPCARMAAISKACAQLRSPTSARSRAA